ncbi:MAG: chemotaxis response regulator protein-glutamate methylesterase [Candidatus Sericytochromatia bacterium]|nr:chemotaxis response regulator protein-glutamate methylesterase [Candidatus Sericytochromatia bacterium]
MIKILVADDSAFMRSAIDKMLSRDPEFNIIGFCINGLEVLEKLKNLKPDVLTLDIEMPEMDGLQVLEEVMKSNPLPIIMVSSLTNQGNDKTLQALEMGAFDVVDKQSSSNLQRGSNMFEELSIKIKLAAKSKIIHTKIHSEINQSKIRFINDHNENNKILLKQNKVFYPELIVIGISTGGPACLYKIIPDLPKDLSCPIIIAQHMPMGFTKTFSKRLNQVSEIEVKEAEDGDIIKSGMVFICPSGFQTEIKKISTNYTISIKEDKGDYLYKPSIDLLFSSASQAYKNRVLGIIMTGMGNDGTKGAIEIKKKNGKIFVQSPDSCVISSMPDSIIKEGLAEKIYNVDSISRVIKDFF